MNVISVMNQKGGVGKTTTSVNLGVAIATMGKRVLLIDLDPQANLGTHLGLDVDEGRTIYDVLVKDVPLAEALRETSEDGVFCVPSNLDLSAAELELVSIVGRETLLRDALERLERENPGLFDYVLIDCPPSLGVLSVNALAAADRVLVPLQAEFFALQGMAKLTEVIELVQRRLNPKVHLSGIVACKVDRRPKLTQEVLDEVRRFFGTRLMKTMIRPNVKLAEAPSFGQSVISYAPESNGAHDYLQLAREFLGLPIDAEDDADQAARDRVTESTTIGMSLAAIGEVPVDHGLEMPAAADPGPLEGSVPEPLPDPTPPPVENQDVESEDAEDVAPQDAASDAASDEASPPAMRYRTGEYPQASRLGDVSHGEGN